MIRVSQTGLRTRITQKNMAGISVSKICVPFGGGGVDWSSYWNTQHNRILFLGDSFTVGWKAGVYDTQGFAWVLGELMKAEAGDAGHSAFGPNIIAEDRSEDSKKIAEALTGRTNRNSWLNGWYEGTATYSDTTTTLTITVGGRYMDLIYSKASGGAQMHVSIDGGAAIDVNPGAGTYWSKSTIDLGSTGNHAIVITGHNYWKLAYVIGYDPIGVSIFRCGWAGAGAANFSVGNNSMEQMPYFAPKLTIIELGTNDWLNQTALATYETNMDLIIHSATDNSGAVIIINQPEFNQAVKAITIDQYNAVITSLAATYGATVYDLKSKFVTIENGVTQGWQTGLADGHPTTLGHSVIAADLFAIIKTLTF
jgi:lysophospholipase L1-like esterase